MRIEQARHLHGERTAARHHFAITQILPGSTQNGERIDARMIPEPAIFILDQGVDIAGRNLFDRDRIAPDPVAIGKPPQWRTFFINHHPRRVDLFQRQRPQAVGDKNQSP
ncbi:hypothetical protein D3C87_1776480 [compost metagenome]